MGDMQGSVLLLYGLAPLGLAALLVSLLVQRGRRGVLVLAIIALGAFGAAAAAIDRSMAAVGAEALAWVVIAVIALVATVTSAVASLLLHRALKRHRASAGADASHRPPDPHDRDVIDLRDER